MIPMAYALLTVLALLLPDAGLAQTASHPLPLGSQAPVFSLMGTDGKLHNSLEWKDSTLLVVAFLSNSCTQSQLYEARLNSLIEHYAGKGVNVVAIQSSNPNAFSDQDLAWSDVGENLADMKERATYRKFQFPYLYDGDTGGTASAFGASVAPSVFILDRDRRVRYSGRIDDDPGV